MPPGAFAESEHVIRRHALQRIPKRAEGRALYLTCPTLAGRHCASDASIRRVNASIRPAHPSPPILEKSGPPQEGEPHSLFDSNASPLNPNPKLSYSREGIRRLLIQRGGLSLQTVDYITLPLLTRSIPWGRPTHQSGRAIRVPVPAFESFGFRM